MELKTRDIPFLILVTLEEFGDAVLLVLDLILLVA